MLSLIVLVAFPFLIWHAYKKVHLSKISPQWPTVPGVVTAAERVKRGWSTQPRVTYSYQVRGQAYASSKVSFADAVPARELEPILSRYPVGQKVEVTYQPDDPAVAILEPGPNRYVTGALRAYLIWFGFIVLINVIDLGLAVYDIVETLPGSSTTSSDSTPASSETQIQLGNRLLRESADKGDAQDQFYVALWYLDGRNGYPKDDAQAIVWLQKSAAQGNAQAEDMLGNIYGKGMGVTKDLNQAAGWFLQAAAQGEPHACFSLGVMTEKGLGGIPQDNQQAIQWYQKAGDIPQAKDALKRLGAE